ncbi:hypothetical protein AURDEDRAFT_168503 [Auricularia subglabra TFB-10046 SS5]|nr:hypothetical protein AURDEDRAFT_168503 [Auricularia subglabra TFB-10046 SS5]
MSVERSGPDANSRSDPNRQYAMLLHNELQKRNCLNSLTWDDRPNGVRHAPAWLSIVYIGGMEYGRSVALTKQAARDEAARQALKCFGYNV